MKVKEQEYKRISAKYNQISKFREIIDREENSGWKVAAIKLSGNPSQNHTALLEGQRKR